MKWMVGWLGGWFGGWFGGNERRVGWLDGWMKCMHIRIPFLSLFSFVMFIWYDLI
jgi:hypothetical protein